MALTLAAACMPAVAQDVPALYAEHCAACHGADRLGGMGPALLPGNLERLKRTAAEQVIAKGRLATRMPGFEDQIGRAHV